MNLTELYILIALTKVSLGILILMVFFGVTLFICISVIGVNSEEEKRMISIGSTILMILAIINCLVPDKQELVEMIGGLYYTNGPAMKNMDPAVDAAIHEFLKEYAKTIK